MYMFEQNGLSATQVWEDFGHIEVIRLWASEIKYAITNQANHEQWLLVGRAVTIVYDDVDMCRRIYEQVALDAGLSFLMVSCDEIMEFLADDAVIFPAPPCLLYLEPGDWMKKVDCREMGDESDALSNVQARIKSIINGFNPESPIIIGTSTSDFDEFDIGFRQLGLFDRRFSNAPRAHEKVGADFLNLIGREKCSQALTQDCAKVGKLLDLDFDDQRRQGLAAMALRRLAHREQRAIEFTDLVHFAMYGTMEMDSVPNKNHQAARSVAIHEAGHATIAIIDSNGENVPDYVSAVSAKYFNGIVAECYAYSLANEQPVSYRNIRHHIRIGLAGRAAEQLVLGIENISVNGANNDLSKVNALCAEMFSCNGISPDMEDEASAGKNLIVYSREPSQSDYARVEAHIQYYLEKQYAIVLKQLRQNRELLDKIIDQLLERNILTKDDINALLNNAEIKYDDTSHRQTVRE